MFGRCRVAVHLRAWRSFSQSFLLKNVAVAGSAGSAHVAGGAGATVGAGAAAAGGAGATGSIFTVGAGALATKAAAGLAAAAIVGAGAVAADQSGHQRRHHALAATAPVARAVPAASS